MVFIGVDSSLTGTGLVVIDSNYKILESAVFSTPSMGVERLFHLEQKFDSLISPFIKNKAFSAIERGAYKEQGRIFELGEWSGVAKLNLFKKAIDTIIVAPLQLKKYATGTGKSKGKTIIILDVYKKWGEEIRDDNIADAYVLARICRDYYYTYRERNEKLKPDLAKYQVEVLKKIYEEHDKVRDVI